MPVTRDHAEKCSTLENEVNFLLAQSIHYLCLSVYVEQRWIDRNTGIQNVWIQAHLWWCNHRQKCKSSMIFPLLCFWALICCLFCYSPVIKSLCRLWSDSLSEGLLETSWTMSPDIQPHTEYCIIFSIISVPNWALLSNLTFSEDEVSITQESIKLVSSENMQLDSSENMQLECITG